MSEKQELKLELEYVLEKLKDYSTTALIHSNADGACGRAWLCSCAACLIIRRWTAQKGIKP